ncbi:MAG TPA: thioredoxin peroxidase [Planctomycetia bacterium]|nr:thioredoxin peroxidase [Planctomycetia bacterium]
MVKVRQKAPTFEETAYVKGEFKTVKLSDYKGKWVVLFFYPLDFTFICPTEIERFAQMEKDFQKHNAVVLAASTDSEFSHKNWFEADTRLKGVKYPVIADTAHRLSSAYGVLLPDKGVALRGTFIIDPDGTLRYSVVSDLSVGRNVDETLRALQALQSGELCPVEWEPGQKTLGKA